MSLSIGTIGLASFYGPAYAERAARRADCTVEAVAAPATDDEALAALNRPTPSSFAETHDCHRCGDIESVLDAVDAVTVATPITRRAAHVSRVLERDLPTLVAKPAAGDPDAAVRLASAATDTSAPLLFTRPARYDDAIVGVADRVADGTIGDVIAVRADIRHDCVPAQGIEYNAEHAPEEAGSAYSMAVYTADALLWLATGEPTRVTAEYENANTPTVRIRTWGPRPSGTTMGRSG